MALAPLLPGQADAITTDIGAAFCFWNLLGIGVFDAIILMIMLFLTVLVAITAFRHRRPHASSAKDILDTPEESPVATPSATPDSSLHVAISESVAVETQEEKERAAVARIQARLRARRRGGG